LHFGGKKQVFLFRHKAQEDKISGARNYKEEAIKDVRDETDVSDAYRLRLFFTTEARLELGIFHHRGTESQRRHDFL
jgi:hypothetical protein